MTERCKCCGKQLNNLETIVVSGFNGFFCDTDCYFRYTGSEELGPETEIIAPSDAGIERIDTMNTLENGYVKLPIETYNELIKNNVPELVVRLRAALLDASASTWNATEEAFVDPDNYQFPFNGTTKYKLLGLGITLDDMLEWAEKKHADALDKKAKEDAKNEDE